ncbi:MAG: 2-succinyl-5-enolpyruvyl-6-hydroxy-3-cyclohexene-1-carboxylic-acid synthase [Polyangiaceae bacterium]|nr:2-succinyl-5-enolpyruvyl-6-hydroxy-3-cyclohexene-1-carboxylic-acid synthase [Polyangiaceae bacterium]
MSTNLHIAWAKLLFSTLEKQGVRNVIVSPGSRSTPLALAAYQTKNLTTHVVVDERSAAFFALGQARVTGQPTALVCTSGTAAAHYYPAVIEAALTYLPMLIITADRPWEMLHAAASQTIDQTRLFGVYARAFYNLGAPEPHALAARALVRTASQAFYQSLGPVPGPVHLNAPFRKPLEPVIVSAPEPWEETFSTLQNEPPPKLLATPPSIEPSHPIVGEVLTLLKGSHTRWIVAGPMPAGESTQTLRRNVGQLSAQLQAPIVAESVSQLRFGSLGDEKQESVRIASFEALFRSAEFRTSHAPDLTIELGLPVISSGYAQILAEKQPKRIVVAPHGWGDPASSAALMIQADPAAFCKALSSALASPNVSIPSAEVYTQALAQLDKRVVSITASIVGASSPGVAALSQALVAHLTVDLCPADSLLVLGNSSPVRDVDVYAPPSTTPLRVIHQRGAAGIDGLIAGAAGTASLAKQPVVLLLGDVSFVHDLGSLTLARKAKTPLVIVIVNNGGGRIFEQLPIGKALGQGDAFERLFATPEPLDIASVAAGFDIVYACAHTAPELKSALASALTHAGATLIEAVVPPHQGAEHLHTLFTRTREFFSRKDTFE